MRRFFNLVVLVLCLGVMGFVTAPWFAFRALKAGARDGDAQALAELIDYPLVRTSLKGQMGPTPTAQTAPPDIWSDPLGAFRRALEPLKPAAPQVEHYLSPAGLYALTRGYAPPARPRPERGLEDPWPTIRYWGPNRCRIAVRGAEEPARETLFTFQRRGLFVWKLVDIRTPDDD